MGGVLLEGAVAHATRGRDGRQEGRLNVSRRRSDTWGLARSVLFPMAHWCLSPVCPTRI